MANNRKKTANKAEWIFKNLLLKVQRQPLQLKEDEIIKIYMRAIDIAETISNLEYIYIQNGEIDKNILGTEENYE